MAAALLRSIIPILPVHSIARAVEFYHSLGFSTSPYGDADDYAFAFRDGLEIQLRRAPDLEHGLPQHSNPSGCYFLLQPGAALALEAEFRAAGVPILSPLAPREWRMFEFMVSDPDANLLRFGEPVPSTGLPS